MKDACLPVLLRFFSACGMRPGACPHITPAAAGSSRAANGSGSCCANDGWSTCDTRLPSKLAKLGGPLQSDTAFEHSMPLWLRIAHTRLCLSVKALHTCLPAGQDRPSTVHLPSFHAMHIFSPLRICVALFEPLLCPLPFAFFCFFGWAAFVFGRRVTGDAAFRRLVCFVRTILVGLGVSVGSGLVLRPVVCGSQTWLAIATRYVQRHRR